MPNQLSLSGPRGALALSGPATALSLSGPAGTLALAAHYPSAPAGEEADFMPGPTITSTATQYAMPGWVALDISTVALGQDTLYCIPVYTPFDLAADRVGFVVTSGSAGSVARLGLYGNGGMTAATFRPASLVEDFGTVDTGSTGSKEIAISRTLNGWSWLAVVSDGTPVVRSHGTSGDPSAPVGGASSGLSGPPDGTIIRYSGAGWAAGGLPADLSGVAPQGDWPYMPYVFVRVAGA